MSEEVRKITSVSREIKAETARMLWAVSGGICEFRGCPTRLFSHHVTGENINLSEKAHIYAFSEGGKRFSRLIARAKINDIDNLMLVCESCHKLIDNSDTDYSAEVLIEMKKEHEQRIELLTSIKPDLHSEVVIYNCNIGNSTIKINDYVANMAIIPDHYPTRKKPISLSPSLELYDNEDDFWSVMSTDLERRFNLNKDSIADSHISLFAIAPQPLLFKLGTLLNRNYNVDVRQSQNDISDWKWGSNDQNIEIDLVESNKSAIDKDVVLLVEITAGIADDEVIAACGNKKILRVKVRHYNPKCIKSTFDLKKIVDCYREALNKIRSEQPPNTNIHLIPIAPASVSIEMGRHWMKGDPNIIIYDRNYKTKEIRMALEFNK